MAKGAKSVNIRVDTSQFDALMSRLEDAAEESVRPAAQAGANVLYEEAKRLAGREATSRTFSMEPHGKKVETAKLAGIGLSQATCKKPSIRSTQKTTQRQKRPLTM